MVADSMEAAVVVDSTEAAVAHITAEEGGARVMAAVVDVLTAAQAERHLAHFQGRALMGIAATHMAAGLMARTAADLRQCRLRARASVQRRAALARLRRRATRATLELQITVGPEPQLRGIVRLRLPLHSLEIQDRRLAEPVRL